MKEIMGNPKSAKVLFRAYKEIEERCPVLKNAHMHWAAKALMRNYHKNRREHVNRGKCLKNHK